MIDRVVFITRRPHVYKNLSLRLAEIGMSLEGHSFIKTTTVPIPGVPEGVNWLFFMSPASVSHFFEQGHPLPAGIRLGTLGEGTAAAMAPGLKSDFIGSHSDTEEVGEEFNRVLGNDSVAFVRGTRSLGRLQAKISTAQSQSLICYDTSLVTEKLKINPEVVVFSSPSNAEGFFLANKWEEGMKAVAFGSTTARTLENLGAFPLFVSDGSDEKNITEAIFKALSV